MTQKGKFVRPEAQKYIAYLDLVAGYGYTIRPRPLPWEEVAVEVVVYIAGKRRGDADNYLKSLIDGLQRAGVLQNDKVVTDARVRIFRCEKGQERAEVEIREVS
jgi:Holliday junction resolvase RusA-like endonuclease